MSCLTKTPVITDTHFRHTAPERRIDTDYLGTQLAEFEYVVAQSTSGYVLCCGDVFDDPRVSYRTLIGVQNVLKKYNVRLITTVGQHDVYGHNIGGYADNTALGALETGGYCTVLCGGRSVSIPPYRIYGYGYREGDTEDFLRGRSLPCEGETNNKECKVALVHASVGGAVSPGWDSISNQNIKGVDYAFFGDIHTGFESYLFTSGAIAYSPGAMVRSSIADIGRAVKYAVLHSSGSCVTWSREEVPVQPLEELLDMEVIKQEAIDASLDFRVAMERAKEIVDEAPQDLVIRVASSAGWGGHVVEEVLDRLKENETW